MSWFQRPLNVGNRFLSYRFFLPLKHGSITEISPGGPGVQLLPDLSAHVFFPLQKMFRNTIISHHLTFVSCVKLKWGQFCPPGSLNGYLFHLHKAWTWTTWLFQSPGCGNQHDSIERIPRKVEVRSVLSPQSEYMPKKCVMLKWALFFWFKPGGSLLAKSKVILHWEKGLVLTSQSLPRWCFSLKPLSPGAGNKQPSKYRFNSETTRLFGTSVISLQEKRKKHQGGTF